MTILFKTRSSNLNGLHSKRNFDKVKSINAKPSAITEGLARTISDSAKSEDGNLDVSILTETPNLYKQNGISMSNLSEPSLRFLKLIPSDETMWLLKNKPNAFLLLTQIAERARREDGHPDGLKPGESYLGDHENCGLTRQKYRTALKILKMRSHIEILETCRTRQKSTNGSTTGGTKVKLISLNVYDVNIIIDNQRINHWPTTDQPPTNHKQEGIRSYKNEKNNNVVGFSEILNDAKLDHEDKVKLTLKFSEERIALAHEYAKNVSPKTTYIAMYWWHCSEINPPVYEKPIEKKIREKFKHGEKYNGADCWIDSEGIAFQRGSKNYSVLWKDKCFKKNFDEILKKFGIDQGEK